jgi:hypothetical protein
MKVTTDSPITRSILKEEFAIFRKELLGILQPMNERITRMEKTIVIMQKDIAYLKREARIQKNNIAHIITNLSKLTERVDHMERKLRVTCEIVDYNRTLSDKLYKDIVGKRIEERLHQLEQSYVDM